ncbi:hypothetical protein NP493_494g04080 [Ridgeia piscesae]|uniref:Intermembrane lipid transfer protein VPS13-like C-terminal domain-containing protein n=1 Tax=Ridgeia piscesae TaxID=27915 RepID=A0AAD9KXY8_RIDPI|nr:hypothetical protein NP493_494g04080 [Ridgeia piscesae]
MAFFERQGVLLTFDQLASEVKGHYILQAMQQAYVFVLGLDVLGNPYGLVKDFTKGLGDFFYEPIVGTVQGPDKIAENLVRGVQSLMGHTVGSLAGSVALITGSLGKALAVMSFDKDYRKRRRQYMQQHPAHLPESFYLAGRGFVMGVALGLSGVIVHPFRGAQEEGVEGFFKGIGKGLLGLITKPPGGTVDMVSMAFDGIRRAAEMGEDVIIRMRLPRYINSYTGLKPYSPYQAIGMSMLNNVAKGQFAKSDTYWAHAALSTDDRSDIALVSDRRVLLLARCRCWGGWDVEMDVSLDDIMAPPAVSDNKLIFRVREGSDFNLITSGERMIPSDDHSVLLWLQKKIARAMILDL